MEFISNLIKRPISLVLNDSAPGAEQQQQQQQTTNSVKSQTPPPIVSLATSNNFDLIAEQQQLPQQQRNNCIVNHNCKQITINDKNLNCNNNNMRGSCREPLRNKMSKIEATNNGAIVDIGAVGDYEPPPPSYNSFNSSSNSNSSSSSNTATTIEELLVQINDNLNQAEIVAQHEDYSTNDLLGASSRAHSPVATKSQISNKLQQPPQRPQVQTPTTPTIFLASLPTHTAAGSAVSESTSKDNKLQIDAELEPDALDKNHLSNVNTGLNKINKFIGLTQFDESSIPELPGNLNPNIEEQLKLTFEENLIPTLTASSIAVLAAASKKDDTPKALQLPNNNESETAVSSDNEIFTECQTFPALVNSASVHDISDMGSDHVSETETFRSALNYNNANAEALDEQLNETLENVADLPDEENSIESNQAWHNLVTSISEDDAIFSAQNVPTHELTINIDENVPMDVDMDDISQYMQYTTNVTLTADEVNSSATRLILNNSVENAATGHDMTPQMSTCNKEINLNLDNIDDKASPSAIMEQQKDNATESQKKSPQFPLKQKPDKVHFPRSPGDDKRIVFLEKSEYSENLATSPEKNPNPLNIGLPVINAPQLNETINISEENTPDIQIQPYNTNLSPDVTSLSVLNKSPANQLNCTFNTNSSATANASPHLNETINISEANSPSYQMRIMSCNTDLSPSSPVPISNKLNCTFGANTPSPHLNKTVNIDAINSRRSQLPVVDQVNSTIDDNVSPSEVTGQKKDKYSEFNAFNLKQYVDTNKRFTFTIPEIETQEKLNESSEPMDVDEKTLVAESVKQSLSPTKDNKNPQIHLSSPESVEHTPTSPTVPCDMLSAKEKTSCNAKDEKDVFVENFSSPILEDLFKSPSIPGGVSSIDVEKPFQQQQSFTIDENFENNHELFLNPSDIDFLYTKGSNNVQADLYSRNSLLLKFDPLLGKASPLYQTEKKELLVQKNLPKNKSCVNSAIEENEEEQDKNHTASSGHHKTIDKKQFKKTAESAKSKEISIDKEQGQEFLLAQPELKNNARMSVDVIKDIQIENDCNKSIENSNTQLDEKQSKYNMDDLEKKIKNEVLKTEDIEKKLKEAEQREEALIKRITEKDKSVTKMNSVIEAYEKAIAELISEKEQLIQSYEKQLAEVKIDRDSNYQHLTSLETTFSDLHVKYEKSKEMTMQLKASEESLLAEKKQNLENLRLQEQRYEKMKNHAMQQLETANRKLETIAKEHSIETTKLKALLKKEEISRASINEQLQQKSRENAELVKICDELINGQGS